MEAPRVHRVLLTADFNAALVQRPRLGFLGWQRNYLCLGVPLMQALSPQQFRAVLVHEFGHLSGQHGRFSAWIYRVRQTWAQLIEKLAERRWWGLVLFARFFEWYVPFLGAYSFVLARAHEYEADRLSAQLVGARNMAEALILTQVKSSFLENSLWPGVLQKADEQPEPPTGAFTALGDALRAGVPQQEAVESLRRVLREKTGYQDTHPALGDRLAALGYVPEDSLETRIEETAAQYYLGDAVEGFRERLERGWKKGVTPVWRQRYEYAREARSSLQALEAKAQNEPLTEEEAWNRARWAAEFRGSEAAVPLLRELLARDGGHVSANYLLGQILLQRNDPSGIGHIEEAMARDPGTVLPGCQILYRLHKNRDREEEAERYRQRAEKYQALLVLAQRERDNSATGTAIATTAFRPRNCNRSAPILLSTRNSGRPTWCARN